MSVSTALPCRISIYEEGGKTILATLKPTTLLATLNSPQLEGNHEGGGIRLIRLPYGCGVSVVTPLNQPNGTTTAIVSRSPPHSQPFANPARRKPLGMYGHFRISRHNNHSGLLDAIGPEAFVLSASQRFVVRYELALNTGRSLPDPALLAPRLPRKVEHKGRFWP